MGAGALKAADLHSVNISHIRSCDCTLKNCIRLSEIRTRTSIKPRLGLGQSWGAAPETRYIIENWRHAECISSISQEHNSNSQEKKDKISANRQKSNIHVYKNGSVWIDPQTHCIIRRVSANKINQSNAIYAVGAMTRGQIIDASMARGIVQSTAIIADNLIDYLKNPYWGA